MAWLAQRDSLKPSLRKDSKASITHQEGSGSKEMNMPRALWALTFIRSPSVKSWAAPPADSNQAEEEAETRLRCKCDNAYSTL